MGCGGWGVEERDLVSSRRRREPGRGSTRNQLEKEKHVLKNLKRGIIFLCTPQDLQLAGEMGLSLR